jgi:hypothetical protein
MALAIADRIATAIASATAARHGHSTPLPLPVVQVSFIPLQVSSHLKTSTREASERES